MPLRVVLAVKWGKDRETAVLSMVNGDRLQGRLALAPLAVETCFGDVSLPVALHALH